MISVIIPVYNSQLFLEACLDSLSNQTVHNFEIVLVNDGSTDDSGKICNDFAKRRPNTIVVEQENKGLFLARLAGMRASSGKHISNLDSDDCLRSDFMETIQNTILDYDPDIICFDFSKAEHPSFCGTIIKPGLPSPGLYKNMEYSFVKEATCEGVFNNVANKVIKREVANMNYDQSKYNGLIYGEDWLQTLSIVDKSRSAYFLDEPLYFYRINAKSSSNSFRFEQINDLSLVFENLVSFSAKWGESYSEFTTLGICRNAYSLIASLALSGKTIKKCDRLKYMNSMSTMLQNYCESNLHDALAKLSPNMSIVLKLLVAGKYSLSYKMALLSEIAYRAIKR